MNSSNKNEKILETPEKRNSLSLNDSSSFIQLRDGSYKKVRNKSYKDIYLNKKSNNTPLSNNRNKSMNYSNKSFIDDITYDENLRSSFKSSENKRKKNISFKEKVYFNHNRFNSENNYNNLNDNNYLSEKDKKNIYVNEEVKEQIIKRALDKYNRSFIENSKDNLNKNNLNDSSSNNLKQIQKIITLDDNDDNNNISKLSNKTENIEKVITVYKDNFPYKKYEIEHGRNSSINSSKKNKLSNDLSYKN